MELPKLIKQILGNKRFNKVKDILSEYESAWKLKDTQLELIRKLSNTSDLEEALKISSESILKIWPIDAAAVYLKDSSNNLVLRYHQKLTDEFVEGKTEYMPGTPQYELVSRGEPHYWDLNAVNNLRKQRKFYGEVLSMGIITIVENGIIGTVNVVSYTSPDIPADAKAALETIVSQISGTIRRIEAKDTEVNQILDNILDMVIKIDRETKIVHASHSHEEIIGISPEELIGKYVGDYVLERVHKDDIPQAQAAMYRTGEDPGKKIWYRFLHNNGQYIWLETSKNMIYDKDGEIDGAVLVTRDMTEMKKAMINMKDSAKEREVIIDNVPSMIIGLDNHFNIQSFNKSAEEITGYRHKEIKDIFVLWEKIYPDADYRHMLMQKSADFLIQERDTGGVMTISEFESVITTKDGRSRTVSWNSSYMFDTELGEPLGSIIIGTDITELKMHGEKLEKLVDDRTDKLKRLVKAVSHQLRTPIQNTISTIKLILGDNLEKRVLSDGDISDFGITLREGDRSQKEIEAILHFYSVTVQDMNFQSVDLLDTAKKNAKKIGNGNDCFYCDPSKDYRCYGDPHLLGVVMNNLIGNAFKYSSKKEDQRVEFGVEDNDGQPVFYVRDNGAGFPNQYNRIIFDELKRLHDDTDFPGTGVGLSIVKDVIERHGGKVWAEGEVGKGACFYFILPDKK